MYDVTRALSAQDAVGATIANEALWPGHDERETIELADASGRVCVCIFAVRRGKQ
ncbi:MAG: hypothetical protein ACREBC_23740 [Pyrinomonadaceae bacterium]